jgi:hypothetical protein
VGLRSGECGGGGSIEGSRVFTCALLTQARFVQSWKANGVAKSRQKKRSSPPGGMGLPNQLGKQQKRQEETASDWQRGGGPSSKDFLLQGGAPKTPPPLRAGQRPPVANLGGGGGCFDRPKSKGPRSDEERRLETEKLGEKANAGMPDRSAALAMHAPLSAQEGGQALGAYFNRQAQQQLLGLGAGPDGSAGGINLGTAPPYMRRSVIRGEGDKVQKLDPQAGLAVWHQVWRPTSSLASKQVWQAWGLKCPMA